MPQLEALSILAGWCRGLGAPFGSGPLREITFERILEFIAGEFLHLPRRFLS